MYEGSLIDKVDIARTPHLPNVTRLRSPPLTPLRELSPTMVFLALYKPRLRRIISTFARNEHQQELVSHQHTGTNLGLNSPRRADTSTTTPTALRAKDMQQKTCRAEKVFYSSCRRRDRGFFLHLVVSLCRIRRKTSKKKCFSGLLEQRFSCKFTPFRGGRVFRLHCVVVRCLAHTRTYFTKNSRNQRPGLHLEVSLVHPTQQFLLVGGQLLALVSHLLVGATLKETRDDGQKNVSTSAALLSRCCSHDTMERNILFHGLHSTATVVK